MKVALVTGGSGGIGAACAVKLAECGYKVALCYAKNEEKANSVKKIIEEKNGICEIFQADVSDLNQVKKLVSTVVKTFGGIDVLINSAGVVNDEYLLMMTEKSLDSSMNINVKGCFYCSQQVALKMFRKKSGVIINVSSVSGEKALVGQSVYSATKGAVNSMTKTLAKELAEFGIRVNAVAPGFVDTAMLDNLNKDKKEEYLKNIPMHRFCAPEEVASVVVLLASDEFSYVTGQIITIDGGLSL